MVGDRWNVLTVLLLPDHKGVVPFRLRELANISQNGVRRGSRRKAGFFLARTVESVKETGGKEGNAQQGETRWVQGLLLH